jgi:hypothetical protein
VDQFGCIVEVELLRGDWKRLPNNPMRPDGTIHPYAPPEHTSAEMDRLLELHAAHEELGVPVEVEAAWLHHRFTQIHPFHDGNGRVARALASMLFIKDGLFPPIINRDTRIRYIDALEKADDGDLLYLIELFVDREKHAIETALSQSADILRSSDRKKDLFGAIEDRLRARKETHLSELQSVYGLADYIADKAAAVLSEAAITLRDLLQDESSEYWSLAQSSNFETAGYYRYDIVSVAKQLGYFADTNPYKRWERLVIIEQRRVHLVLAFHSLGQTFTGIIAIAPFLVFRDTTDENETVVSAPIKLSDRVFTMNYRERKEDVEKRFALWLDEVILFGLDEWRRQL